MYSGNTPRITLLAVLALVLLGGCTTTYKYLEDWEGRSVEDLYFEWGKPDEVSSDGRDTVHTWISTRTVDGEVRSCRKSFVTRNYGNKEVVIDTSYEDCPFFTLK